MNAQRHIRVAPLLMAILLMVAAMAPALCRTTCVISGRSVLDVGHVESCCADEAPSTVPELRAVCCEHSEAAADVNDHTFSVPGKLAVHLPLIAELSDNAAPSLTGVVTHDRGDRAPPRKAPERLSRFCSLLL